MMFLESGTFFLGQEGSVRNIIRDKLYLSQYVSYKRVYYIKLYLLWVTKPLVGSKMLIDIIIGVRNLIHGSGRFLIIYNFNQIDNLLSFYKWAIYHSPSGTFLSQTSLFIYVHVVYQIIGTFSNKSNGVVKSKFQKKYKKYVF